jgi:glycosyltransferase involved in cell wall biosynthesis
VTTWHVLVPEYPPACGGVGDYTALVADGLADAGDAVHVWHAAGNHAGSSTQSAGVAIHPLPDCFQRRSRAAIDAGLAAAPGILLVQYVPSAFGLRGMNVPFCRWLAALGRNGTDVRVMFHEPFFYFGAARPWRNVLAIVQRRMASMLLRASARVYYSTEAWRRLLAPFGTAARTDVLPIPSTVPVDASGDAVARWRARRRGTFTIGHFGTYGQHIGDELAGVVPALVRRMDGARALLIGEGGAAFTARLPADVRARVESTGRLRPDETAAALRACDLLIQPYPDGVTTRRTSIMAALTASIPVLTTRGALTEGVWAETGAVALAPAGDVAALVEAALRLSQDPEARAALGRRGRRTYDERFALSFTIDRLRAA